MSGPETPTDEARRIVHEILIDAPLAAVWRAVTSRALIAEWLGANDLKPETGRRFSLEITDAAGEASVADGQVLEVEAERRLRFSLAERDDKGGDEGEPAEIRSTVQIELIQTEAGVLFRLTHDGFERVPLGIPAPGMVWAVAQQRVLRIRRAPRTGARAGPIAVRCALRRLAWAA
jgi:uncharacterized protein YndB with AHSA1/START domain